MVVEVHAEIVVPQEAKMLAEAWDVRDLARLQGDGKTMVGAVALDEDGVQHRGTNVQHRYRCHDLHAEVAALANMVAWGGRELQALAIVAERERFTPCGSCLDWVFELGGPDTVVLTQAAPDGPVEHYRAAWLMPHYPR